MLTAFTLVQVNPGSLFWLKNVSPKSQTSMPGEQYSYFTQSQNF